MEQWLKFLQDLYQLLQDSVPTMSSEEVKLDAYNDLSRLEQVIDAIMFKPDNWIVSNIEREGDNDRWKWRQQQHILNSNHIMDNSQDVRFMNEPLESNKITKVGFPCIVILIGSNFGDTSLVTICPR